MNLQLKAYLEAAIQQWVKDNCEEGDMWPEVVLGKETIRLMTEAAAAVFSAVAEAQDYGKREGYFE